MYDFKSKILELYEYSKKYPVFLEFVENFSSYKEFFELSDNHFSILPDEKLNDDEIDQNLNKSLIVFKNVENRLGTIYKNTNFKVPVYNFNAKLILEHSQKIQSIDFQIAYLEIVLHYYNVNLKFRYTFLDEELARLGNNFHKQAMITYKYIYESVLDEYQVNPIFPKYFETFFTLINAELASLKKLKYLDISDLEILNEINYPPGTKIKREVEEEKPKPQPKNSEYLTSREVMEHLKITRTTLYNYQKRGLLNPKKVLRNNLYPRKEVEDLLVRR